MVGSGTAAPRAAGGVKETVGPGAGAAVTDLA